MTKTRIAPSPTGNLHIGTVRTAFYNWLFSRHKKGEYIVRIEDTDTTRSTKFFEQDILDGFKWLGLNRDNELDKNEQYGPYYQMKRLDIYKKYVDRLLEEGLAYKARETSEELEQLRQKNAPKKQPFIYRKINYTDKQIQQFKNQGRKPAIRVKIPEKTITINDMIKGEVKFDTKLIGDFVIMKSDGIPTYHFANVIDDHLMKISHIIRGEDHLNNTPKQIILYEHLNFDLPFFGHLPLILNWNKTKMSKRDTESEFVTINKFRQEGFLPQAVLNFVLLLGRHTSDDQEFFDINELIKNFDISRFHKSNPVYDFNRAIWFNSEYIKNSSDKDFVKHLKNYLKDYGDQEWKEILDITEDNYWLKLAPFIKVRLQTLGQFMDYAKYFFKKPKFDDEIILNPKMKVNKTLLKEILPEIIDILSNIQTNQRTQETLKNTLIQYVQDKQLKNGQVLWPLRAILTGVKASPGGFEMLYILGKNESLERLNQYLKENK